MLIGHSEEFSDMLTTTTITNSFSSIIITDKPTIVTKTEARLKNLYMTTSDPIN